MAARYQRSGTLKNQGFICIEKKKRATSVNNQNSHSTEQQQQLANREMLLKGIDFVSNLKIYCEKESITQPVYNTAQREITLAFVCQVRIQDGRTCIGNQCTTKKAAKQSAASVACKLLSFEKEEDESTTTPTTVVLVDMDNFTDAIDRIDPQRSTIHGFTSKSTPIRTGVTIVKADNTKMVHLAMAMYLGTRVHAPPIDRLIIVAGDKVATPLVKLCSEETYAWTLARSVMHCKHVSELNNL